MAEARFHDLRALAMEKERLHALCAHQAQRLERHWSAIKDGGVRNRLLRRAVVDAVSASKPARALEGLWADGRLLSALGPAVFRRGSLWKRLLVFATRAIGPYLLERADHLSTGAVIREVGVTAQRIRERLKARG